MNELHLLEDSQPITRSWSIANGLPGQFWDQLIQFSKTDEHIRAFTSDEGRFGSAEEIKSWLEKGRDCFTVTDNTGAQLQGFFWFGPKDVPIQNFSLMIPVKFENYTRTLAKRLYKPLRSSGQGSKIFSSVLKRYFDSDRGGLQSGFWVETSSANAVNIALNQKFGFRVASEPNVQKKILMIAEGDTLFNRAKAFLHDE